MAKTQLTYEQWLEAVGEAEAISARDAEGALTSSEWAERRGGLGRLAVNNWINAGLKNGWLEFVKVRRLDRTGVPRPLPAYRLVKVESRPKRRR